MRDALEFGIKSFFAGCLGFLGAITMVVVSTVLFGLVFKSQIQGLQTNITGKFQSIPDMLSQESSDGGDKTPSMGEASSMDEETSIDSGNVGELPSLVVYITEGGHPDNQKLTTITKGQATNVSIWVNFPAGSPVGINLEITLPDGTKHPLGQGFDTDPTGNTSFYGKLDLADPAAGIYILDAFPEGNSYTAGTFQFNITE